MAVERFRVLVDDEAIELKVERDGGRVTVESPNHTWEADLQQFTGTNLVSLILDGRSYEFLVDEVDDAYGVLRESEHYRVVVRPAWADAIGGGTGDGDDSEVTVECPLVGVVMQVFVKPKEDVERGDILLIIEAMKMQNEIRAPRAGIVKSVKVAVGDKVAQRQALVVLA